MKCPKCNSEDIQNKQDAMSAGHAAHGVAHTHQAGHPAAALFFGVCWLAGKAIDHFDDTKWKCRKCNHHFGTK